MTPEQKIIPWISIKIHNKEFKASTANPFISHLVSVRNGRWEPNLFNIFDAFLNEQYSYIDMGAWLGITALYGCQLAKHCYAIEPDPMAMGYLMENLELNPSLKPNITISNECIYNSNGEVILGNRNSANGGNSHSSIFFADNAHVTWKVPAVTFEQFLKQYDIRDYNFIKMDVMGAEAIILPNMFDLLSRKKTTIYVALYPTLYESNAHATMLNILNVLDNYKHVFLTNGIEIRPRLLSDKRMLKHEIELLATNISISELRNTAWGSKIQAL